MTSRLGTEPGTAYRDPWCQGCYRQIWGFPYSALPPLLPRRRLIGGENLIHERTKLTENRGRSRLRKRVGRRLGVVFGLADGVPANAELLGDFTSTQPIPQRLPNPGKIVHSTHPCRPAAASSPHARVVLLGWTRIGCPGWT
jgi:hypothetical protein